MSIISLKNLLEGNSSKNHFPSVIDLREDLDYSSFYIDEAAPENWMSGGEDAPHSGIYNKGAINYSVPDFDVSKATRFGNFPEIKAAAKQLFYDFYAMETLHRYFGPSNMSTTSKMNAAKTNPDYWHGFLSGANWGDVEYPLSGAILNKKLVDVIEHVYEQVTRTISDKLLSYLRMALVQEFRYLMDHAGGWTSFRHALVSQYNKNKTISNEDFKNLVIKHLPLMEKDIPSVMRLLKFSKCYKKMSAGDSKDPFDIARKSVPYKKPTDDPFELPPEEPEEMPEPEMSGSIKPEDEFPDDTDYSTPLTDDPFADEPMSGGSSLKDPTYSSEDWYWNPELKKKVSNVPSGKKKSSIEEGYASGQIDKNAIKRVQKCIDETGITWEDIDNAYNKVSWGGSKFGGPAWGTGSSAFLKLLPKHESLNIEDMGALVDHIFDLQHNTGKLLNKGGMDIDTEDMDKRAKITHIARYLPMVSPPVKKIIMMVLKYLPGNPEEQKDIDKILNSPTKSFTPEETKVLSDYKFYPVGDSFQANIKFFSKEKDHYGNPKKVEGRYYTIKSHTNGKYTISDTLKSDIQVFDKFEDAVKYIDTFKKDIQGVYGSSYMPSSSSEKDIYIDSHTKIKLPVDKEQLLYQIKMGWRKTSKCYKAYFPVGKRFLMYAFSDNSFLCTFKGSEEFQTFTDWNAAFTYCTSQTKDADDSHQAEALANIGTGSTLPPPTHTPSPAPSTGTQPPGVKVIYTLDPSEFQAIKQLIKTSFPESSEKFNVSTLSSGVCMVTRNYGGNPTNCFSIGQKKSGFSFAKPYKVDHYINGMPAESWGFPTWTKAFNFLRTNVNKLVVPDILSSQAPSVPAKGYSSGTSPSAYTATPLPPNSTSKASYNVHSGISAAPKTPIRLTPDDEEIIKNIGFEPKMVGSELWYIHKTAKDVVKFYPNNTSKIVFSNKSGMGVPVVQQPIDVMLKWLPQNYSMSSTSSPLSTGIKPINAPASSTGIKAGFIFEKKILAAGFVWDDMGKEYVAYSNGPGSAADILKIFPDRSSKLTLASGTAGKFKNLPELMSYLAEGYLEDKKKSNTPVANVPQEHKGITSGESSQIEQIVYEYNSIHGLVYNTQNVTDEPGQSPYVAILKHPLITFVFSIGALGNYYQINDADDKIIKTYQEFPLLLYDLAYLLQNYGNGGASSTPSPGKGPTTPSKSNVLTEEEKEWIITYVSSNKPEISIADYNNGTVLATDPNKKQDPTDKLAGGNPLFFAVKNKSTGYHLTYYDEDWGQEPLTVGFKDFEQLQEYVKNNLDGVLTHLIKNAPEKSNPLSELLVILKNAKFKYVSKTGHFSGKDGDVYDNDKGDRIIFHDDGTSIAYLNDNPVSFNTLIELINWIKHHYNVGATNVYHGVDSQFDFNVPKTEKSISLSTGQITANIANSGFKLHHDEDGTFYAHSNGGFWFRLYNDKISWTTPQGTKEVIIPPSDLLNFLGKALSNVTSQMTSEEIDNAFSRANESREGKLFGRMFRIAQKQNGVNMSDTNIGTELKNKGFLWDPEGKFYINEELNQIVVVSTGWGGPYHLYWITQNKTIGHSTPQIQHLFGAIGPDGHLAKYQGDVKLLHRIHKGVPSGETYKTHDNEANAHLIKLNDQDEELLDNCGFVWTPQENHYYKNAKGDIFKFSDTGKAWYIDHSGKRSDSTDFKTISHALKFAMIKFPINKVGKVKLPTSPFSKEDYNENPTDDQLHNIKLNDHDHQVIEKDLGFKFDEKKVMYIKHVKDNDNPKLEEAGKKKEPHKAQQFELPIDDPISMDYEVPVYNPNPPDNDNDEGESNSGFNYEIFVPFNSGNATWTVTDSLDDIFNGENEKETKDGTIKEILDFLWHRWSDDIPMDYGNKKTNQLQTDQTTQELNKLGYNFVNKVDSSEGIGYNYNKRESNFIFQVIIFPEDKFLYSVFNKGPAGVWNKISGFTSTIADGLEKLKAVYNSDLPDVTPSDMPFSGFDYSKWISIKKSEGYRYSPQDTIKLKKDDQDVLEGLGFYYEYNPDLEMPFRRVYIKGNEKMYFFASGQTSYWDGNDGPHYFPTVKEGMKFLWDKNKNNKSKRKPKKTGKMWFSDYPYHNLWKVQHIPKDATIQLTEEDDKTMNEMGFKKKEWNALSPHTYSYVKGIEQVCFYADGSAKHWANSTINIHETYPTVQEMMEILWSHYSPFIEEALTYKSMMELML